MLRLLFPLLLFGPLFLSLLFSRRVLARLSASTALRLRIGLFVVFDFLSGLRVSALSPGISLLGLLLRSFRFDHPRVVMVSVTGIALIPTRLLSSFKEIRSESFGLRLLVANVFCVQRALRQNDLNARGCPNLGIFSICGVRSLLDDKERVELVDVAEAVSSDQGDQDGLLHAEVECLDSHFTSSL